MKTRWLIGLLLIAQQALATHFVTLPIYKQDTLIQSIWKGQQITDKYDGAFLELYLTDTLLGTVDEDLVRAIFQLSKQYDYQPKLYPNLESVKVDHESVSLYFSEKRPQKIKSFRNEITASLTSAFAEKVTFHFNDTVFQATSDSINVPRLRLVDPAISNDFNQPKEIVTVVEEQSSESFFQSIQTLVLILILLMVILTFVWIFKTRKG